MRAAVNHHAQARRRSIVRALALAAASIASLPATGVADPTSARFCDRTCDCGAPPRAPDEAVCLGRAAVCLAERAVCEGRLALYEEVMAVVGEGAETAPLPRRLAAALARFFPRADLATVRVGWSSVQPAENAITDCTTIYFASRAFVERVLRAELASDTDWRWLLHELRHAEQCAILGGREAYASAWMEDAPLAVLQRGELDLAALHDAIPMEGDAEERAAAVTAELSACCRADDGKLR